MNAYKLLTAASAGVLIFASASFAAGPPAGITMGPPASVTMGPPASVTMGPPASVTMGPPASVTMGPPAAALAHIPQGVSFGRSANIPNAVPPIGSNVDGSELADHGVANAASLLGNLNAAHASPTALEHASPHSIVGAIAAYKNATITAQAAVTKYTNLVGQDQTTFAAAQVNLTSAQNALTTLQNSGTATSQQLTDAQTAVANAQTAVNTASAQLTSDQASLTSAQTAVVSAQTTLASAANKPLTPTVISQLNSLLGI